MLLASLTPTFHATNIPSVSALIAQGTEFPLVKPAGFHWDIFLLGLTTGVAGILGLPFPNGLIPQAPFHTASLCVTEVVNDPDSKEHSPRFMTRTTRVVEQRVSNLAQGLLTLGTMTGPLLVVLHLIPQGVLAGLFFIMGFQALQGNGITAKIMFLVRDKQLPAPGNPLSRLDSSGRKKAWIFVGIEILGFAATFAITQTVAAVGFPVVILALIPVRALVLPRWFTPTELALLDAPTAGPFVMESVGGSYGGEEEGEETVFEEEAGGIEANAGNKVADYAPGAGGAVNAGLFEQDIAEMGAAGTGVHRRSAVSKDGEGVEMQRLGTASSRRGA